MKTLTQWSQLQACWKHCAATTSHTAFCRHKYKTEQNTTTLTSKKALNSWKCFTVLSLPLFSSENKLITWIVWHSQIAIQIKEYHYITLQYQDQVMTFNLCLYSVSISNLQNVAFNCGLMHQIILKCCLVDLLRNQHNLKQLYKKANYTNPKVAAVYLNHH